MEKCDAARERSVVRDAHSGRASCSDARFTSRVKREAVWVGLEPGDPSLSIFGYCAAYARLAGLVLAHPCEEKALSGNASGDTRRHPSSAIIEAISEISYKRQEAAGKRPQPQSWQVDKRGLSASSGRSGLVK